MLQHNCKIIISAAIFLLIPVISLNAQEPINIEELFEKIFFGQPVHVHGRISEHGPPDVMIETISGSPMESLRGLGLNILSNSEKKLTQKLFIQCKEKICSVKGKMYQNDNTMTVFHDMVLDSYTTGIHPNSIHIKTLIEKELYGTPVFYEGKIDWGPSIEKSFVKKNRFFNRFNIDFSRLSETEKLSLLDIFGACQNIRVVGNYYNKTITASSFKCLDNS